MKFDPHFWQNMYQNWQNWRKNELDHASSRAVMTFAAKTDPKNKIQARRTSGKVIILPELVPRERVPKLALLPPKMTSNFLGGIDKMRSGRGEMPCQQTLRFQTKKMTSGLKYRNLIFCGSCLMCLVFTRAKRLLFHK